MSQATLHRGARTPREPRSSARPPSGSLRRALASHVTLFAVLPAIIGGLIIAVGGGWVVQAEVFSRLQSIADATCEQVQLICTDSMEDLDRFAGRPTLRQAAAMLADPSTSPAERARELAVVSLHLDQLLTQTEHHGGAAVLVSLLTGRPLAWRNCSAEDAREITGHHAPRERLKDPQAWLSPAHRDHTTGTPVIAVTQALAPPEGRSGPPVAAIIQHVPLSHRVYRAIEEQSQIGRTGEIVFVDRTGLALRDLRDDPGSAFRRVVRTAPVRAATSGVRAIKIARDYRGVPVVAAVGHVPATGWGIVAKQDAAEAYAPMAYLGLVWLTFVALLMPTAMAAGRRLSARFLQPIEELALATHLVAQGDPHTAVPEHRDDELGALVADFNQMASQIAASQHALRESETAFRSLFEQAAVGVAQVGLDGRWQRVNQRLCDIVGYTANELLALTFQDITHPDDLDADLAYVGQVLAGEIATYSMEKRYFRKDRSVVWINLTVSLVRDPAGAPRHFISVIEDISERHAAQGALTASEERYRSLFEGMIEGYAYCEIIRDDQGRPVDFVYLEVNPAFADLTGYVDVAGKRVSEVIPGVLESAPEMFERYGRVAATGEPDAWEFYFPPNDRWFAVGVYSTEPERFVVAFDDITGRRRAEASLRESEARYRSLFDNMLNGFALHEMIYDDTGRPADYRFLEANAAFEAMTGLRRAECVGRTVLQLIPDLEHEWIERYGRVVDSGEAVRFEQHAAPLGRWFSVLAFRPQPGQFATIFEDITERHRAEEALAAANARVQATISASPVAIYMMDRGRGIQLWNAAAEQMFGWSEAEVLGMARPPIVPPDADDEYARVTRGILLQGGTLPAHDTVRAHRDGTPVPVSISAAPLRAGDGTVTGWVAAIADIRERERAEREFEERTALDKLVRVTHGLLAETTPEGLLQRAVEGACGLTEADVGITGHGYHAGSFSIGAVWRAEGLPPCPEGEEFVIERGGVYMTLLDPASTIRLTDEEFRGHPDFVGLPPGHMPLRGLLGCSLAHDGGRPSGILLLSHKRDGDFTARDEALLQELATFASLALARLEALRELELQARSLSASNRELEAFSYSVSHDLRAPLRAMDGFSQALLDEYPDVLDEQARHYLSRVRSTSQRMGELIDDLLQLSRVTREPMQWEEVDLSALALDIIAQLRASEPGRSVAATVQDGLSAHGHPALLRTLLANLLGNAWKFTSRRADARIEFGATQQDGETVYFVRDNGAGFDMRYAEKLFSPFQRLHAQQEFPGNGVGLATVQRVVNRHGGRAWAEGAVDQGATFCFALRQ